MFFELSLCVRLTRPCVSSSFNRREIVVDDDSTNFFRSENRIGSFFRSNTSKICIGDIPVSCALLSSECIFYLGNKIVTGLLIYRLIIF